MNEAFAVSSSASMSDGKAWFIEDRFGMFIHFGLYALAARHEWVQNREEIGSEQYRKYFENFDPDLYDPREWARRARQAGMKYVVLTAKHHEGFCLGTANTPTTRPPTRLTARTCSSPMWRRSAPRG